MRVGSADGNTVKTHYDIRLSNAEAAVLLQLARRLRDEPAFAAQLNVKSFAASPRFTICVMPGANATGAAQVSLAGIGGGTDWVTVSVKSPVVFVVVSTAM